MANTMFFDTGLPGFESNDIGIGFDIGLPFYMPGALNPTGTRVIRNLSAQGVALVLYDTGAGAYYTRVLSAYLTSGWAIEVPTAHITGPIVALELKGVVSITTETTAPSIPTDLTLTPGARQMTLTWTNPSETDFIRVKVIRTVGAAAVSHDEYNATNRLYDGTVVYDNQPAVPSNVETVVDVGLNDGTVYYYTVFVADDAGHWSTTVTPGQNSGNATPVDVTPPARANITGGQNSSWLRVYWKNPADYDLSEVVVRRKGPYTLSYISTHPTPSFSWVNGSNRILVPTNTVLPPGITVGDFVCDGGWPIYRIGAINIPAGYIEIAAPRVYAEASKSLPVLYFLEDNAPADHTDGLLVYQNLAPVPNANIIFEQFGVPAGSYFYGVFVKDSSGNWNDSVVMRLEGTPANVARFFSV